MFTRRFGLCGYVHVYISTTPVLPSKPTRRCLTDGLFIVVIYESDVPSTKRPSLLLEKNKKIRRTLVPLVRFLYACRNRTTVYLTRMSQLAYGVSSVTPTIPGSLRYCVPHFVTAVWVICKKQIPPSTSGGIHICSQIFRFQRRVF